MAIETVANTTAATTPSALATTAGSVKVFLLAHPVGVAVVGGALVGVGAYYLMKKFSPKTEEPATA